MMDFKEFLLLEEEEEEKRKHTPRRSGPSRRAGDDPPPKSYPKLQKAVDTYRLARSSIIAAKRKRDRTDADTTVRIAASTDLTNPTLKRLSEIVENLVERSIVSASEIVPKGAPTSTKAAVGMTKLTRTLRTGTSGQRERMRGISAGAGQKGALN